MIATATRPQMRDVTTVIRKSAEAVAADSLAVAVIVRT